MIIKCIILYDSLLGFLFSFSLWLLVLSIIGYIKLVIKVIVLEVGLIIAISISLAKPAVVLFYGDTWYYQ